MVVPCYISDGADNLMLKVKEYLRGYVYKYSGRGDTSRESSTTKIW